MNQMKIKKSSVICFILLMPVFQPISMSFLGITGKAYSILSIIVMIYGSVFFIRNRIMLSTVSFLAFALKSWIFLVTIFYGGDIGTAFHNLEKIAILVLVLDMYSERIQTLLKCLMLHFELCIYINLLTIIVRPDGFFQRTNDAYGLTQEWFLGADNYFVVWVVPAILIAWIYKYFFSESIRCYVLTIAAVFTEIICGSTTGLIGVALLTFLIVFPFIKLIFTPFRGFVLAIILFVLIVYNREFVFLETIIVDILHKDMTFSSRLDIWDNAINAIFQNPIVGYGVLHNNIMIEILGKIHGVLWKGATHCHCQILQVALQAGLVGLCIYACMFVLSLKKCVATWNTRIGQVFAYAIIVYTIICITEVFEFATMYLIIFLPFYAEKIVQQSEYLLNDTRRSANEN